MGGKGNAQQVLTVLDEMLKEERWSSFFKDFEFPYGFYGPEEYKKLLLEAGLKPGRVELLPKEMKLQGKEGLLGWIRTCWMPYTQKLPANLRKPFMKELADRYLEKHPLDENGIAHLKMARLEVQANKT
jgi:trans-aconitate methyltransferase